MEGQGSLIATGLCSTNGFCPGMFTATVSGPPLGAADVTFDVTVGPNAVFAGRISGRVNINALASCFPATGSGTMNGGELTLVFTGTLCAVANGTTYSLRGGVQIYTTNQCPTSNQWTAISGTLDAFGEVHTAGPTPVPPPTPIPVNPMPAGVNHAIVSLIGSAGQLPAPCPSP